MAKIMLVEDDNNLREIYEARLLAEGYEIVAAKDGEDALALAVKEKPDLIISDVMMPKISGFDMLDILRSTPETKNTKVIMMTALSQAEDKGRADRLGADRYLVKSQVTLEDVAKVAQEVLSGEAAAVTTAVPEPATAPAPASTPEPVAVTPAPEPPVAAPSAPVMPDPTPVTTPVVETVQSVTTAVPDPASTPVPEEPATAQPSPAPEPTSTPEPPVSTAIPVVDITDPTPVAPASPTPEPTAQAQALEEAETTSVAPDPTPVAPEASQPEMPAIAEELTQTSQEEADAAETQINEILAQAVEPDMPAVTPETAAPEASTTDAQPEVIEVAQTPPPTEVDGINQPVFTSPTETAPATDTSAAQEVPTETPQPAPANAEQVFAPTAPVTPSPEPASTPPQNPINQPVPPTPAAVNNPDSAITGGQRVIQPINDLNNKPDLSELLKKEEAKADVLNTTAAPMAPTAEQVVIPGATTQPNTVAPNVPGTDEKPMAPPPTGSVISPNDIAL